MRLEHFRRLKEVSQRLKDGLNQIFLRDVNCIQHQGNQVWVLLQDFERVARLSQVVNSDDGESFQRGVVGLQVGLDNWVQLVIVSADIRG